MVNSLPFLIAVLFLMTVQLATGLMADDAPTSAPSATSPTSPTSRPTTGAAWEHPGFSIGERLFEDRFANLETWVVELEKGGEVRAADGKLEIDVPAGCTVWFRKPLEGDLLIEYEATAVRNGGPNDRVSDLNCFWMATDARSPGDFFAKPRNGKFNDYDELKCYYVGLGGNGNTTTRFRRYIGEKDNRPLLPEHDLKDPSALLVANQPQTIRIVCLGGTTQYYRDATKLFELRDEDAYRRGWFGFRTVTSRLSIQRFTVCRIMPDSSSKPDRSTSK